MRLKLSPVLLLAALLALGPALQAAEQPDEVELRARLARLQSELEQVKAEVAQAQGQAGELESALRAIDRRVAASAGELLDAQAEVERIDAGIRALQSEQQQVERDLLARRDQLRLLLRSAYAAGQWAPLKLWLDQDRFADATRALGYHQYLKRRQIAQLEGLRALLARKQELVDGLAAEQQAAALAVEQQAQRQLALEAERAEQGRVLAGLQSRRQQGEQMIAALRKDESALRALIDQVSNLIADIPREMPQGLPLSRRRGALPWPLVGELKARFGSRGGDGQPLQGLRIGAPQGTPVHAVAHGRVAFADWLRGHGLLIIVDHGEGFMSLYAHCETLTRAEGDWVDAGEQLATVGRSGGGDDPALHFELRRGRNAIDPLPWLQRRR